MTRPRPAYPEPDAFKSYSQGHVQAHCKPARLVYEIPEEQMRTGASDDTGPGLCYGIIAFGADGQAVHRSCQAYHCETLRYGDGREGGRYCTIIARCENGIAKAVDFTW